MSDRASVAQTAAPAAASAVSAVLQRSCACGTHTGGGECQACASKTRALHRKSAGGHGGGDVPPIVHDVLGTPGRPLDATTRAFMEPRFGHDFSRVRVHADVRAAEAARAVHAHAFTAGDHLVFGAGRYDPGAAPGARLLAHELTHVVQQSRGGAPMAQPARAISHPADAAEVEADAAAERVVRGEPVDVRQPPSAEIHGELSTGEWVGIGVGIGAAATGLGLLIAWGAGAFDPENFTDPQLREYLTRLARTGQPERARISDNKARDVVRRWVAGRPDWDLDAGFRADAGALTGVQLKRLLIQEMLDGVTGDADERSIITILERSSGEDVLQILDPRAGVSMQQLDDKIGGDNHTRLEQVLETKLPAGSPGRAQTTSTCTARQALMVHHARQRALTLVDNAITMLTTRRQDPTVQQALQCRFPGASAGQVAQIRGVLERTRAQLPTRNYFCGAEGGRAALDNVLTTPEGLELPVECVLEDADSFIRRSTGTALPHVFLCGVFFGRSPESQATTIVHESVHAAGLIEDPAYQPACGLDLATALRNPDSFAYLVNDLMAPAGAAGALPSVSVGNFRNTGPVSPDNQCPVCLEVPGLGLDTATGLNIMELRGDISGDRHDIQYDFKRTKERVIWRGAGGSWRMLKYDPPGTADERVGRDEHLTPARDRIFNLDGPGLANLMAPLGPETAGADEAVYKASFVQWVNARVPPGPWTRVSNEFHWHSMTWLDKTGGSWERKPGWNEVEEGAMTIGTALPYGPGDYPMPPQGDTQPA